jgi:hypothetical protein
MERARIRWIEPQHTGDDFDQIKRALEIGDDEGPIILLPVRQRGRGMSKASGRYPAQLFENPLRLIAHLVEHANDLDREFWIGICEDPERSPDAVTAGLWYFKDLLNRLGEMNRSTRLPARGRQEADRFAAMTYGAISEPPLMAIDIVIENSGNAFDDIAKAMGDLPRSILISRA